MTEKMIKKSIIVALEKDEDIVKVNEQDEMIGFMPRKDRRFLENLYRVIVILITNSEGEILITKRSKNKSKNPNQWSQSVAGVVNKEELEYEIAAKREAEEELGLKDLELIKGPYIKPEVTHNAFIQVFYAFKDVEIKDLKLQEEEVQAAKWVSLEWLKKDVDENPSNYVGRMKEWIAYFEQKNDYV